MRESELLEYFLLEAGEHLAALHKGLKELQPHTDNLPIVEDLFRAAHTLKGSAAIVKLDVTSSVAHKMEDILEALMEHRIALSDKTISVLSSMFDVIASLISDLPGKIPEPSTAATEIIKTADEFLARELAVKEQKETTESIPSQQAAAPAPQCVPAMAGGPSIERRRMSEEGDLYYGNFIRIDVQKIEAMLNLIGEITIRKNYLVQRTRTAQDVIEEITFAGDRLVREVGEYSDRHAYSYEQQSPERSTDRFFAGFGELEFDSYDESNIFARKLQEITNDIQEGLKELSNQYDMYAQDVRSMDRDVRELRADISEARMLPVDRLFQRFRKAVREMAKANGRQAELRIHGGDTKIDRVVFEHLFDPLMHIIRNAIAHGIELPAERLQKGKPEQGEIVLSASREGNIIAIQVRDDGRGIDTERLKEQAIRQGILKESEEVSKQELLALIFQAGISTKESADQTSGRGIGMTAVRRQVADLSGIIDVDSEEGKYTVFKMHVPTTLAISNVVVFKSGGAEFAIPVTLMEEVTLLDIMDGLESGHGSIVYRGRKILLKSLMDFFGAAKLEDRINKYVVICNISDKRVGLIVDEIIGQEETVIKPLNEFLDGLSMYSGITISGDGRVRFVLNPTALFETDVKPEPNLMPQPAETELPKVLIVDDSLSVRKYVANFVQNLGLQPVTAANGHEALNILHVNEISLIVTDLEMPIMHGYELIRRVRAVEYLRSIPIVVLTSRGTEKHRQMALDTGADDFLVKPFDENSLKAVFARHFPTAQG
ncbi:MAG TPA: response regulator [Dissulfurispiraceae bacterium]|nr:response regulator [Dissulfurispiraceae bacterium]